MRKELTRDDVLKIAPVKNECARIDNPGAEEACIVLERKKSFLINILSVILMIPREKKVALDKTGTLVYNMCDGKNKIGDIAKNLTRQYPDSKQQEIEKATVMYLNQLARKKVIGFAIKK